MNKNTHRQNLIIRLIVLFIICYLYHLLTFIYILGGLLFLKKYLQNIIILDYKDLFETHPFLNSIKSILLRIIQLLILSTLPLNASVDMLLEYSVFIVIIYIYKNLILKIVNLDNANYKL